MEDNNIDTEMYLKIYHEYFVLRWSWHDISTYNACTKKTVERAINWVIENKISINASDLMMGAADAIASRLRINRELYNFEANKKKGRDNKFLISLNSEIREDEKTLFELEKIYKLDQGNDEKLSASQVLALIKANHTKQEETKAPETEQGV